MMSPTSDSSPAISALRLSLRPPRTMASALAENAFHDIAGRIVEGVYRPGDRISDKALAEEFGVSRTPVREAMQRLERIGLVEMHPSRYTVVTELTPEMATATWEFIALYAGNIVHLALRHLRDDERDHLLGLIDDAAAAVSSPTDWLPAQIALFAFLAERAQNELYSSLLGDSWYLILRNLSLMGVDSERHGATVGWLSALADSVRCGDSEAAERAARAVYGIA